MAVLQSAAGSQAVGIGQWRPADSLAFEVKVHVDVVGDCDVHPIVLTVEDHTSLDLACIGPLSGKR
jgi:hypothetical protein